jgi:hypothetical protein
MKFFSTVVARGCVRNVECNFVSVQETPRYAQLDAIILQNVAFQHIRTNFHESNSVERCFLSLKA